MTEPTPADEQRTPHKELRAAALNQAPGTPPAPAKQKSSASEVVGEVLELAVGPATPDLLILAAQGASKVAAGALERAGQAVSGAADVAIGAAEVTAEVTGAVVVGALEVLGALLD